MNPFDEVHTTRLTKAVETSYRELMPFRNLQTELVTDYAGSGYGRPNKPRHDIPINLMNQTVDAYTMALVANRPRILLSTQLPELTFFCKQFQVALNNLIEEIGLEFTLRRWVLDAIFSVGIIKVHLADAGLVQLGEDLWMDPGRPFASNVGLDNWVHDMSATRWSQMRYAGDSYRIPFDDLKHPMYDQSVVANLQPSKTSMIEDNRAERLSRSESLDMEELEPMIDLADIWIPKDGMIYTWPVQNRALFQLKSGPPVAAMRWEGTEFGPYHHLGFNDVPENIMPTSPASHLASIEKLVNNLFRKQSRQARRQKDITAYPPGGEKDAQRLGRADDGALIQVNDPTAIKQLKFGGVDPANQAFLTGAVQLYDRMAGNLTAMLGLGAQAPTASQEQIIQGKVSNKEAQMQYRVMDATTRLIRDLAFLLWKDRVKAMPGRVPVEGTDYSVPADWTPDDRQGTFFDYRINIDVYSMAYQSPQQRVNAINQLISQVYGPMAPVLAAQGGQLNLQKLVEIHADLLNEPRLKELIQFANPLPGEMEGDQPPAMPSATTRNYVRQSVPSQGTPQGRAHVEQQQWLAMAQQGAGAGQSAG